MKSNLINNKKTESDAFRFFVIDVKQSYDLHSTITATSQKALLPGIQADRFC